MPRYLKAVVLALLAAGVVQVFAANEATRNEEAVVNTAAAVVSDVEQGGLGGLEGETAPEDGVVVVRESVGNGRAAVEDGAAIVLETVEKGGHSVLEKGEEITEAAPKEKWQDERPQLATPVGFPFGVPLAEQPVSGVTPGWDIPGLRVPGFGFPAPGQPLPPPPGPSAVTGVTPITAARARFRRPQSTTTTTMAASRERVLDLLRQFLSRLRNPQATRTTTATQVLESAA